MGFGLQRWCEAINALLVQRVHAQTQATFGPLRELSTRGQLQVVRQAILHFQRLLRVLAVVQQAWHFLQLLMQGTAERDVQFLKATANTQHRHVAFDGKAQQRECGGVAVRIVQGARCTGRTGVVLRFHVGGAAGEQQAIHMRQHRLEVEFVA